MKIRALEIAIVCPPTNEPGKPNAIGQPLTTSLYSGNLSKSELEVEMERSVSAVSETKGSCHSLNPACGMEAPQIGLISPMEPSIYGIVSPRAAYLLRSLYSVLVISELLGTRSEIWKHDQVYVVLVWRTAKLHLVDSALVNY
jgi:hypothetical protein